MKFRVKWTAVYETEIEAPTLDEARDEASSVSVDIPGSKYVEDSWEVLRLSPLSPANSSGHLA
jgi:hypothetical protein